MQLFKKKKSSNWVRLTTPEQLAVILNQKEGKAFIFKHSTRCSISSMAQARLESVSFNDEEFYYLDLIAFRNISNQIEQELGIQHQSPQLIILNNGKAVGNLTHNAISASNIEEIEAAI